MTSVLDFKDEFTTDEFSIDTGGIIGASAGIEEIDDKKWGIGKTTLIFEEQFKGTTLDTTYTWRGTLTGTGAQSITTGNPGNLYLNTGANGTATILADGILGGNGLYYVTLNDKNLQEVTLEINLLKISSGSGITTEFGLYNNSTNYILLVSSGSGDFNFKTAKAGVTTSTALASGAITDEQFTTIKIVANKSSAFCYIDGTFKKRINSNIPLTSALHPYIKAGAGASGTDELYVKWVKLTTSKNK